MMICSADDSCTADPEGLSDLSSKQYFDVGTGVLDPLYSIYTQMFA